MNCSSDFPVLLFNHRNCASSGAYFGFGSHQYYPYRSGLHHWYWDIIQCLYSTSRHHIIGAGIPIINLRRSLDRLRFILGIPLPVRRRILSKSMPWFLMPLFLVKKFMRAWPICWTNNRSVVSFQMLRRSCDLAVMVSSFLPLADTHWSTTITGVVAPPIHRSCKWSRIHLTS